MNHERQISKQDEPVDRARSAADSMANRAPGLAVIVFLLAGGVLILSTFPTSSARFAASTDSGADVSSAVLELDLDEPEGAVAEIPLTEEQVLGAVPIASCADVALSGTTEATANFIATVVGGTGLERYANIRVLARRGSCVVQGPSAAAEVSVDSVSSARLEADDPGVWVVYEGPLSAVIGAISGRPLPSGAGGGVELLADLQPGEQLAVGFELSLDSELPAGSGGLEVDLNFFVEVVA